MGTVVLIVCKIYFLLVSHRQKFRRCKDYFFGREVTIVLKISVDNQIFFGMYHITAILQIWVNTYVNPAELVANESS